MTPHNIPCWKITDCRRSECCLGHYQGNKQCWEVASELGDYRSAMNICKDCIVFIAKQERSALSEQELSEIMARKGCVLIENCPTYRSNLDQQG